ncbi:MAG: hydrogenase subunit MbhD domain-containing protein [Candidatus Bipolaricaulaceae bacterium]
MTALLLSVLAFALAVFALTRKRLLWGVIGVGAHSLVLAALYLVLAAPDVALTEAAIGFGLVTFVYLLALRRTGKLVVAASPLYPLLYAEGERIAGLEWEILERFARWCHRDLELIWVPRAEIPRLVRSGEAHVGAGGFLPNSEERVVYTKGLVPTRLVRVRRGEGPLGAVAGEPGAPLAGPEGKIFEDADELAQALSRGEVGEAVTDLLHWRAWETQGLFSEVETAVLPDEHYYVFALSPEDEELRESFMEFLTELERRGELSELVRRYLG